MIVENMPELIGGLQSIQNEIKYPAIAQKAGIEGRVFVQFVVDEQGNVVDPVIVRGIGAGCDEEAIRAVRLAKFKPGRQGGKAVRVKMSLPITFKLTETAESLTNKLSSAEIACLEDSKLISLKHRKTFLKQKTAIRQRQKILQRNAKPLNS